MTKLEKGRTERVDSTDTHGKSVKYLFEGISQDDLSRIHENIFLARKKLAEIKLRKHCNDISEVLSKLRPSEQALVLDFAHAVQGGEAALSTFVHRLREAGRVRNWREQMSPEQAEEYRAKQAGWARDRRERMSPEEAEEYRAKQAEWARNRRKQMSPEQAEEYRAKESARKRTARAAPFLG